MTFRFNFLKARLIRVAAIAVAGALAAAAPARAQAIVATEEYNVLFQQVLRDPSNLDVNFRFAEVATRLGDHEAAIGALERILFYNPNLPRVKLELGILYFRLGSYEMARSYFSSAIAAPDTPSEVRVRVETFLVEVDRRLQTTTWSVYAQAGFRYQTNANAGPSNPFVRGAGRDVILDRQFVNRPDGNIFALGVVRHIYDFENQRGDVWETNLVGYAARQFRIDRLNLALVEIQTGPRLALFPDGWLGAAIRPYVLANAVSLGDSYYLGTWGAGTSLALPMPGGVLLEPFVEYRDREFRNTGDYPTAKEQTGELWIGGIVGQGPIFGSTLRWQARLAVARNDARFDYNSYEQFAADVGFPFEFGGPWGGSRKWVLVPTAGFSRTEYDQPNTVIDPFVTRRDSEWRVGAILDAQVYEWFGLGLQVQYAVVNSNLPNYDTRNFSVTVGPTVRF